MTLSEAVQQNVTKQLEAEAGQAGHSYMFVSSDTVTIELSAHIFVSLLTGYEDVTALKDVYTLPFG